MAFAYAAYDPCVLKQAHLPRFVVVLAVVLIEEGLAFAARVFLEGFEHQAVDTLLQALVVYGRFVGWFCVELFVAVLRVLFG